MWKKNKYYIIIGFFIVAIWFIEQGKPKPINWFESYSMYDKIPYGNKILFEELPSIFSSDIQVVEENIEANLEKNTLRNYLFINDVFNPDKEALGALLNFVAKGNNAMVISRRPSNLLLDTLGLNLKRQISYEMNDSLAFLLTANQQEYDYVFPQSFVGSSFVADSLTHCTVLGYNNSLVNFMKVPFGEGYFFMHLAPLVFTNYHMMKQDNHRYVSAVLSHLPNESIYWDEYYKNRKNIARQSPLTIVLSTAGLRQAFYLAVLSLLVYMLFAAKRKQSIIPVLEEKSNDTLNFTRTVGDLYFNVNNNKDIGQKRIDFFMSDIRKRYHLFSEKLDGDFCKNLHDASGVSLDEIKELVLNFNIIKGVQHVSDEKIIEQNNLIESFYSKIR